MSSLKQDSLRIAHSSPISIDQIANCKRNYVRNCFSVNFQGNWFIVDESRAVGKKKGINQTIDADVLIVLIWRAQRSVRIIFFLLGHYVYLSNEREKCRCCLSQPPWFRYLEFRSRPFFSPTCSPFFTGSLHLFRSPCSRDNNRVTLIRLVNRISSRTISLPILSIKTRDHNRVVTKDARVFYRTHNTRKLRHSAYLYVCR